MSAEHGTNDEPLLRVKGLNISAGTRKLVTDVSFEMAPGERVGLIGESGSGKSLTSTALLGLLPEELSRTGSARLRGFGEDLLEANDRSMRRLRGAEISMIFQEPLSALNPLMRVGSQVTEVMTVHRRVPSRAAARARTLELLAAVKIPDPAEAARAYPHQLSGGQRQRAMIAMALANDPALLLADEPTTALDVTVQSQVLELISTQVRARGTGLLFITHDLAVVANMCTRVLVLNQGRIVESGPIDKVFTAPVHPYTRALLAASDMTASDARGRLFTFETSTSYVPPVAREARPAAPPAQLPAADPGAEGALLTVSGLGRTYHRARTKAFGPRPVIEALADINFTVAAGDRVGIVGESGSGKSTLLRILAGLDAPSRGSVVVAGTEIAGAKEADLRLVHKELQVVFQDPLGSLNPRMRVADIIAEPLLAPGRRLAARTRSQRVQQMLSSVGLEPESALRYPHQFSGGQRQRISIARALVNRPRILLADEPVSALDVSVRAQVLNLLADMVDEYELTLLLVSHDLSVVRHLCERVIVMKDGRIVEAGDTEQIYTDPAHPYTAQLIASSLDLAEELAAPKA